MDAYLERPRIGILNALENARNAGDLNKQVNLDDLAAFFTMSVIGISALIRAKAPSNQVYAAGRTTVSVLNS